MQIRSRNPIPSVLVVLFFQLFLLVSPACQAAEKKNILILHSYHQGYKWTDDETEGIFSRMGFLKSDVNFYIEYMGTKWVADENYFELFQALYKRRYSKIPLALIIASDNDAFNFLRKYRDDTFGKVPVVFCGVNWFKPEDLNGLSMYTGVNEDASIEETLDLIIKLHPMVKNLYVIADMTTTGVIIHEKFQNIIPQYQDRLTFHWLDNMDMSQIVDTVSNLPFDSAVLITIFQKDKSGNYYEFNEIAEQVSKASKVPVYGLWDFHLGYGIVGGMLTSGKAQGEAAGDLALQILQGIPTEVIPVVMRSPNRYMFDYNQMKRFGIPLSALPEKRIVLDAPESFYEVNKKFVWVITAGWCILSLVVVFLIMNINLRNRVEQELRKTKAELEDRVQQRTAELSRTNKELLEAGQRLEDIINFLPDATFAIDVSGRVVAWNKAIEEMTGVPASQMLGKGDYEYAIPFYGDRRPILIDQVRGQEDKTAGGEYKLINLDNKVLMAEIFLPNVNHKDLFVWAKATSLYDRSGKLVGAIESVRDVTDWKEAEKALKVTQNQLLQSEKMASIGQLAAGVAHEINNPTAFVVSNLDMLGTYESVLGELIGMYTTLLEQLPDEGVPGVDPDLVPKIRNFYRTKRITPILNDLPILVSETCDGALRIKKIVMDLRSFAHSEEGERRKADVNALINTALNIAWNEFKYKVEVVKEYGNIPEVLCYSQSLCQVFLNLLVNAAQAIEKKGTVTVRTRVEGNSVVVDITDTGCGMSEEVQRHLFEPFFTTKPVGKGTGLGLSLVYNIVKKHDGTISVNSKVGQGTTFSIKLPLNERTS